MKINGKTWSHNYIRFDDLMNGADIEITLGSEPNLKRGTAEEDKPYSYSTEN
jgi:putative alpha-1,2-mannosidase